MKKNKKRLIISFIILFILCIIVTLFYYAISPSKKELDLDKIKDNISELSLYNGSNFYDITKENIQELLDIDSQYVDEVIGKAPLINIDSSMYVVIKTDKEHVSYVKEKLERYSDNLEKEWEDYLESKYDLVKSRKIGVKSNYVYLVISNDNNQVVDIIK